MSMTSETFTARAYSTRKAAIVSCALRTRESTSATSVLTLSVLRLRLSSCPSRDSSPSTRLSAVGGTRSVMVAVGGLVGVPELRWSPSIVPPAPVAIASARSAWAWHVLDGHRQLDGLDE